MELCKICKKEFKNIRAFSVHLSSSYKLRILDYKIKYENFKIPKCPVCKKNCKSKNEGGLVFRNTCGDKKCISEMFSRRTHTEATKKKIREKRINYMKNNPEKTAWRRKNLSYPEKIFLDALYSKKLNEEFIIIREKSFFPYFADFAFENVKVVVEIDGSQHLKREIKEKDKKKDKLIIDKGWKVYRVTAAQVQNQIDLVIEELLEFIGDSYKKSYCSKIITEKEIKNLKKEQNKKLKLLLKEEEKKTLFQNRINLLKENNISSYYWGIISDISKIWNCSHTQVRRYIKKNNIIIKNYK